MRSQTKVKVSLGVLIVDLVFFLLIREELPVVYSTLVPGGSYEAIAILIGFAIATLTSITIFTTIYNEAKKTLG